MARSPAAVPAKKAAATRKNRLRLRPDSSVAEMKQVHLKHLRAPSVKYDALFLKETIAGKKLRLYDGRKLKFQDRIESLTKTKKASSERKIRKYKQKLEENDAELAAVKHEYREIKRQKKKVRKGLVLLLRAYKMKFRESVDIKVTSVDMLMVLRKLMEWVNFKPKWTISEVRRPNDTMPGPIQVMQQLLQLPNCISTLEGCTTATPAFSTSRMSTSPSASASASAATDAADGNASPSTSNTPPKP